MLKGRSTPKAGIMALAWKHKLKHTSRLTLHSARHGARLRPLSAGTNVASTLRSTKNQNFSVWGLNAVVERMTPDLEAPGSIPRVLNKFTLLDLCVSSLRRGHANLLCIVLILTDDPRMDSNPWL